MGSDMSPAYSSPTYESLRDYVTRRIRMSTIDQPLMLMELLGRHSPATAQPQPRTSPGESWGKT